MRINEEEKKIMQGFIRQAQRAFNKALENYKGGCYEYKIETICMLLCNAWESMLKAYLIKKYGYDKIRYRIDNREMTIGLGECINKVFSNKKDPLRKDLELIKKHRNLAIHYFTDENNKSLEDEIKDCMSGFVMRMGEFHNIDVCDIKTELYKLGILVEYNKKRLFREINKRLKSIGIEYRINTREFELFDTVYGIYKNELYCNIKESKKGRSYLFTAKVIKLIVNKVKEDPEGIRSRLREIVRMKNAKK